MAGVWVIAHRGFSGRFPENTLRAFRAAEELGADMVECDVHASRDGRLVVIHDATLERTTDGTGRVRERTLEELKRCDAGEGERIPTLEEVLAAVSLPVVVELKAPDALPPLIELLRRQPELVERLWPISFLHPLIRALSEAVPGVTAGVLYAGSPVEPWALAERAGAKILLPALETATREEVEEAHAHGLHLAVWTADSEEQFRYAREIGVDGVATNHPDRLLATLGRK
ncbi:MAG: glycerophosphodiester phosphodiesterase family protein [Bacillota bacterium]|nr:glycerophosphodiester phosphodiesterase family protein [Bacillota bacterium]